MEVILLFLLTILAAALFSLLGALLFAWPVMVLWAAVVPDVFGLPELSFWQTFHLLLLIKFSFGSAKATKKDSDE